VYRRGKIQKKKRRESWEDHVVQMGGRTIPAPTEENDGRNGYHFGLLPLVDAVLVFIFLDTNG